MFVLHVHHLFWDPFLRSPCTFVINPIFLNLQINIGKRSNFDNSKTKMNYLYFFSRKFNFSATSFLWDRQYIPAHSFKSYWDSLMNSGTQSINPLCIKLSSQELNNIMIIICYLFLYKNQIIPLKEIYHSLKW